MDRNTFDKEMEFAIQQGLSPSQALECIAFMNKRFPEDLRLRTTYYTKDWIRCWKNEPLAYMDEDNAITYSLVRTTTDVFVESI